MSEKQPITHMISATVGVTNPEDWTRVYELFNDFVVASAARYPHVSVNSTQMGMPDDVEDETFDEGTILRVFQALRGCGLTEKLAATAINAMQNAGILFRERKIVPDWVQAHYDTPGV